MSFMDSLLSNINGIEVGIDIATSITIIVSLIALVMESRRQARRDREKGIDQNARNVAASQLAGMISSLSEVFINHVVRTGQEYESKIDVFFEDGGEDRLMDRIRGNEQFLGDRKGELSVLRDSIGDFFESLHALKYQIFPVLDSLDEGDRFIKAMKSEIQDIARQHSRLGAGYLALIGEYEAFCDSLLGTEEDVTSEQFRMAMSIVCDLDYWEWVKLFVDDEERELCQEVIRQKQYDHDVIKRVIAALFNLTRQNHLYLNTYIYALASRQVQEARMECKDVLCNLSAIYHMLICKDSDMDLGEVIERYKSDNYFALQREIR